MFFFFLFAVIVCVTINGFSFLVTQLIEALQKETKLHEFSKIDMRFDVSFYLIAAAGGLSVIGAACNLMRRYPNYNRSPTREHHEALLSDYEGMDIPLPQTPDYFSPMNLPPPPAYTPWSCSDFGLIVQWLLECMDDDEDFVSQWLATIRHATPSSLRRRLEGVAWRIVASHCVLFVGTF